MERRAANGRCGRAVARASSTPPAAGAASERRHEASAAAQRSGASARRSPAGARTPLRPGPMAQFVRGFRETWRGGTETHEGAEEDDGIRSYLQVLLPIL